MKTTLLITAAFLFTGTINANEETLENSKLQNTIFESPVQVKTLNVQEMKETQGGWILGCFGSSDESGRARQLCW